jgi:hypothetical protein
VNTGNDGRNGQDDGGQSPDPLNGRVQLARVAALLSQRRKRQSVRKLAREIGISKSALDGLVTAFDQVREMPQPHANWQKLKDWYLRQKHDESGPLSDPVDMGMLALDMLADLPEAERRAGVRELVDAMTEIFERRKLPRPAWVARLAESLDPPPAAQ